MARGFLKEQEKGKIKLNLPVKLSRNSENNYYASLVQDIGEDYFTIMVPYKEGRPLILSPGEKVLGRFVQEKTSFFFDTFVLGKHREKNLLFYVLALPEKIEEVQQRMYVRFPIIMDVWQAEIPLKEEKPAYIKTKTLDLSAGGMKIIRERSCQVGTIIMVKFTLPFPSKNKNNNSFEIETRARVVYCEKAERGSVYHLGIEFLDLRERQRDKIFKFIFSKMAKRRF